MRELGASVPKELEWICLRALEKKPEHRYASAAELRDELRRFARGEHVVAQARPVSRRLASQIRRRPVVATTLAALVLVALVVTVFVAQIVETNGSLVVARAKADRERRGVLALSIFRDHEALRAEADALWPPHPELVAKLEAWEARAHHLARGVDEAEDGYPGHAVMLVEVDDLLASETDPKERDALLWWRDNLERLVAELRGLEDSSTGLAGNGCVPGVGIGVARRLELARRLESGFASGGDFARRWASVIPEIAASPKYGGLELGPQMGLVPIGVDPTSGFHEFWHVCSGDEPFRGDDGRLRFEESSGIVLVLLPGGRTTIGAQSTDPDSPRYDPEAREEESPVVEIELSPFFVSKFEVTQGQWLRAFGENPSRYVPGSELLHTYDATHPVEQVTWTQCAQACRVWGLELPTDAQWEYAARGGTDTPWWTGTDPNDLVARHAANVADRSVVVANPGWATAAVDESYDDGWCAHAPVWDFAPNPFGLHHIHGNLMEWCRDTYVPLVPIEVGEKDPVHLEEAPERVLRDGAYFFGPSDARSSRRLSSDPEFSVFFVVQGGEELPASGRRRSLWKSPSQRPERGIRRFELPDVRARRGRFPRERATARGALPLPPTGARSRTAAVPASCSRQRSRALRPCRYTARPIAACAN
ncbi:MAG: SUMF1/EgtB/PvdO family nonheme iron enzyme [Planctomycetota bacterium]